MTSISAGIFDQDPVLHAPHVPCSRGHRGFSILHCSQCRGYRDDVSLSSFSQPPRRIEFSQFIWKFLIVPMFGISEIIRFWLRCSTLPITLHALNFMLLSQGSEGKLHTFGTGVALNPSLRDSGAQHPLMHATFPTRASSNR